MQKIKGAILVLLLAITSAGYSQVAAKEAMAKRIFEVLKNKDEEGYVRLFPDVLTLRGMMEAFMKLDTSAMAQESVKAAFDEMTDSSLQKSFRKDFKKNIKKGEDKGVDWSKAEFVSSAADSSLVNEDGMNTTMLKGKIYFKAVGKDYFMAFDEVIWFENKGWFGVSVRRIDEKSKEQEEEVDTMIGMDDSMAMAADSVAVADTMAEILEPPPARKTTPKQPVKNKPVKTKTKTQTPARKPE